MVIDSDALAAEWRARRHQATPGKRIFPFSQQSFYAAWNQAKNDLALTWIGPPHDLRHFGAARDVEEQARDLEQVRRRGRWRSMDSVRRYTKTWLLVRQRERLTQQQRHTGQQLLRLRGSRTICA